MRLYSTLALGNSESSLLFWQQTVFTDWYLLIYLSGLLDQETAKGHYRSLIKDHEI